MKPKEQKLTDEKAEYKTVEKNPKPKAQPVKVKMTYRVKCIWTGPVKVLAEKTPSGKAYSFASGQEQPIDNKKDFDYLLNLGRNVAGCCSGSGTPRRYFEIA